ncbi:MAG: c-type cytochrome [Planctomycetota bacterium]|nr:MAG: c-type cytochrome [Planctomycetota bacterium]
MKLRSTVTFRALVLTLSVLTVFTFHGCKEQPGAQSKAPTAVALSVPLGLPAVPIPPDNPMTAEKIELGKMLYFEKRLSKDKSISCATCHDPMMAWAEHIPTSKGIHEQIGARNANSVINTAFLSSMFWDGRAKSLEEQALGPIENPMEMGQTMEVLLDDLAKIPEYQKRFKDIFGTDVTKEGVAKAIAAFERTILSGNSPYDRYQNGDKSAMTGDQVRGMEVFMDKGMCATCHTEPIFSNGRFYNAGIGMDKAEPDEGRKKETGRDGDLGKFRVPPLREAANTHPYFHDGSVAKLADAVQIMADGGKDNPNLSPMMKGVREAKLTDRDKKDLVAFLNALSGEYPIIKPPKLP